MATNAASCTAPINYFICTLDEAVGKSPEFNNLNTVNDFLDHRSETRGKDIAVGFPVPHPAHTDQEWKYELFTFEDLKIGSISVAAELAPIIPQNTRNSGPACVALLCPSSIDFLFTWLGCMRAGVSVLLIAPQCQPAAVAHLCKACDVSVLVHHEQYTELASKAASEPNSGLLAVGLPWQAREISIIDIIRSPKSPQTTQVRENMSALDNAFIFHTSGTSTGLPKPIPQTHHAAFRVLPVLDGSRAATFTATPLYHGGIADCFRAWTSGALIWLFPGADIPITTQNIIYSLSLAEKASSDASAAHVKYFSCVPYVMQMLVEDTLGLELLQNMEIVGVGGAALSPKIGNELVEKGVNLVSRFGSAECGFLLASHRNYKIDSDWQYLRYTSKTNLLSFEEQDDDSGLFELIVKKAWPHMTKTNRKDGSFATSDLFEAHTSIKGAWRYHSRSDSQITLSTGKKFDPTSLEDAIASSSPQIREVMIFGSGKQEAGVLVFPSQHESKMTSSNFEKIVWNVIHHLNMKGQDHTRISKNKMVIMPPDLPKLDRSSKGTLLRGAIEKKFAEEIDRAYNEESSSFSGDAQTFVENDDIKSCVRRIIEDLVGANHGLDDDADFYGHGFDSATCTRMRLSLQKNLLQGREPLPWNVVYDCGNINRLAQYILDLRSGNTESRTNPETQMLELVEKYSAFDFGHAICNGQQSDELQHVVLLTGATGALGAHILDFLRNSSSTLQVICLVRATDQSAANSRVSASLIKRRKKPLDISDSRVKCLPCKLSDHSLGLSETELLQIRKRTTHIIHAAWAVNFSLSLISFVHDHIAGIHNILNLALNCSHAVHFTFCSSTASILGSNHRSIIEEKISSDPSDAGSTGYSRSKWVAEAICSAASTKLPGGVKVLRIGQLTGSTDDGVWNMSEAWPLMLSTVDALDCLPNIKEPLSWLPINTAAGAIIDIVFCYSGNNKQCHVYHLVNNSTETTWPDLLRWITETRSKPFDVTPTKVWLDKLENFPNELPAKNLLGLWKNAYGNLDENKEQDLRCEHAVFSIEEAQNESDIMQHIPPLDEVIVKKIWSWLEYENRVSNGIVYVA